MQKRLWIFLLLGIMFINGIYGFDYVTYRPEDKKGDCTAINMPRTPSEPLLFETYTDPNFDTVIRKISDSDLHSGGEDCSTNIEYSTYSSINSDGTMGCFLSRRGSSSCPNTWSASRNVIYNLSDGSVVTHFPPEGFSQVWTEARWDSNDSNILYFVYKSQLRQYDITNEENKLLYDFQDYYTEDTVDYIGMKTVGDYSWDRRYFAFKVHCNGEDGNVDTKKASYIVLWDKNTGEVKASRSVIDYNSFYYGVNSSECSWIGMSPSGQYLIFETSTGVPGDRYRSDVLDHDLNKVAQLKSAYDIGHFALGYDWEGNEVIIHRGAPGLGDSIVYTKLSDGSHYKVFDRGSDCDQCNDFYTRTVSGFYFASIPNQDSNLKGWAAMIQYSGCTDKDGQELEHCWGDKEIFIFQVKENATVWRVAHHQNCAAKYWSYGRITFDPQGQYLYFDSNWRDVSNDYQTNIYRAELPTIEKGYSADWYEDLSGPLQTCQDLDGTCCSSGASCSGGTFQLSSDCGSLCCVGGICSPKSTCNSGADKDDSGEVSMDEVIAFIEDWKTGSITIDQVIQAIGEWKNGC